MIHPSKPEILVNCDLVVVGGGIAGCCAAMAAARLGLRVALVQNRPVLGGNASSEIGLLMAGADRDFPHVRETGLVEEIDLLNRYHNHEVQWRNSISDALLEQQVIASGVDLYLSTHVHAVEQSGDAIVAVTGAQQATEKVFRFTAPLFVDATGDGHLAALAGASAMIGSESRGTFGEPLAPVEASSTSMGSTLMFRVKDVGHPVPFVRPDWADHFPRREDLPVVVKDPDKPQLWIEYGAYLDTIGDNEAIRRRLLAILYGVWDHIKNHGSYGAEQLVLSWVGAVPGKRESRRVIGDHILTQHDLMAESRHPDAVAYGGWPVDIHNPDGFAATAKWTDYTHLDRPYTIPYRCYYARDVGNLFLAGRCISTSHVAHGSIRLIRTCAVGGQAVGTAAALCCQHGVSPRVLGQDHIHELQQTLLRFDCHIPGICNEDAADLARSARVEASSECVDPNGRRFAAVQVVSGLSRGTPDNEHLWMSEPLVAGSPAWLALHWDAPVTLSCLQVTCDTMIREQRFFDRPLLGPVPTCVRDYAVETLGEDGHWRELVCTRDNVLRHRIERFAPNRTRAIRIRIDRTWGDSHARIYEVRAYAHARGPAR